MSITDFIPNRRRRAAEELPPAERLPAVLRSEPSPQERRVAKVEGALAPRKLAPPAHPLSEEARKMVDEHKIKRAEAVRDSQRVVATARLAEFKAWAETRRGEMDAERDEFERYVESRTRDMEAFRERVYAWGDDHVAKVTAEQEEEARLHARDVDIVNSTLALLDRHGVALPPEKPPEPKAAITSLLGGHAGSEFTPETCPGHVASEADPQVCGRCGVHIDEV
jgi:hypothetical protein